MKPIEISPFTLHPNRC